MPQFSDDTRVYKLSTSTSTASQSYDNKFLTNYNLKNEKTHRNYDTKVETTITELLNEFGNIKDRNTSGGQYSSYGIKDSMQNSLKTITIKPEDIFPEESLQSYNNNGDDSLNASTNSDTPGSTLELPEEESRHSTSPIPIIQVRKNGDFSADKERKKFYNETVKSTEFQDYLPMEMLRKVHETLRSQPSDLEGKIRFLKQFERDLIAEIEERLSTALTPSRRRRGGHDYYDHDDHELGFPSLEGALMAISFLTFAVYLVRIVMLLFRNPNNTANTGATVLFGRKRRSIDKLDIKTEEIFSYLDSFVHNN